MAVLDLKRDSFEKEYYSDFCNDTCDYCKLRTDTSIIKREGFDIRIVIYDNGADLDIDYTGFEENRATYVHINYCPMCGRNLRDEEE